MNKTTTSRALIGVLLISLAFPLFVFPFAGRWDWGMGWAVVVMMAVANVVSRLLMAAKHPDLIEERARSMRAENTQPWDKVLAPAMALIPLIMLIVASLDERFSDTAPLPLYLQIGGLFLIGLGYAFATWAIAVNRFFSGVVRIQTERGHHVVAEGPYAIVRHPGYTGALLGGVGTPLALSSSWVVVPLLVYVMVTLVRTGLEDRTLRAELAGYGDYARRTRYRLLPWIW